jgi:hypothetical protein
VNGFRYHDTFSVEENQCTPQYYYPEQNENAPNSGCYSSQRGIFLDPQ